MRIRFTREYAPKDGSGVVYKVGDEQDFTPSSAMHFINREAAVAIETQAPKVATPKAVRQETAEKPTRKPRVSAAKGSIK